MSGPKLRPGEEWKRPEGGLEAHKVAMRAWLEGLVAADVPPLAVAFEALVSAASPLRAGVPHEALREGYPFADWQAETVELPAPLVQMLADAWLSYRKVDAGKTMGEAFGLEGGGQGRQPARVLIAQHGRANRLSNAAIVERLIDAPSWEAAYGNVAEREQVSDKTVRRASEKGRDRTMDELRKRNVIE